LLTNVLGNGNAPDLGLALTELKEIKKVLAPYVADGAGAQDAAIDGAPVASSAAGGGFAAAPGQRISGEVQSRQDVLMMLDKICDYYAKTEPASPVPNLLRRARRMADMDFMQIINEMCPEAANQVRLITGERAE
jgi:type VI secretion system protein ImpA